MPPIPAPRRSGFTATTDVPLYWCAYGPEGSSRALVLHGGPGASHDYLLPQMLELAHDRELVFYDQRGGGRSRHDDDRGEITWRSQVADLDRVIHELCGGATTLVGYSWGGLLALLFAVERSAGRATANIDRLVLIDPAPVTRQYRRTFEDEFARRQSGEVVQAMRAELNASGLRATDPEAFRQRSFELSVAGYFADPRAAHDLTPFRVTGRTQQSIWDSLGDYDLLAPGQLDTVHLPAFIAHGRQDPIPLESSERCAESLGAELLVIEHSGHVPYVERPDALFPAIERFLATS